ncbi:MAG: type II toxin-antitoxin system HicB family antitoxin [Alphaproteobacteria bacterium]|nr:type II toxin-antitoxin system HicB family antitoxin [Alphaproteobacteria bacterium]
MQYTIVVERAPKNYATYVSDLPGCVATGDTREDAIREIRQAIRFHIASLREHGEPVPEPRSSSTWLPSTDNGQAGATRLARAGFRASIRL